MRKKVTRSRSLNTAITAAHTGGKVLLEYFDKEFRVDYKGEVNLVTEADYKAEGEIIKVIQRSFPDHGFLAEESGEQPARQSGEATHKWIIDPLDGTTNFAHAFPLFCVSIALEVEGEIILGVVYDPIRKELFTAERNQKATLNGCPIQVSRTSKLDQSLLVTGFAYDIRQVSRNNLDHFSVFSLRAQGVRRTGSAALDLCYMACGRLDGFWEMALSPWDTAAGYLIAIEAGATVTDFSNKPFHIDMKEIVSSNGCIHQEMIEVLGLSGDPEPS